MQGIQLFKEDFDNLENRVPHRSELLGTFIAGNGKTAQGNVDKFIQSLEPYKLYLGYDGETYPKLRLAKIKITN